MTIKALILFMLILWNSPAHAVELLNFKPSSSKKEDLIVKFAQKQAFQTEFPCLIAAIDLNNDFINEYVIKSSSCLKSKACPHAIIAYPDHNPLIIGNFDADKIIVEDTHNYGVRNLRVYDNANNSYAYKTAKWNPFSYLYETE